MTDNKKAVADISGTEPVARGIQQKKPKKKRAQQQPSDGSNYQNLYAMPTFRDKSSSKNLKKTKNHPEAPKPGKVIDLRE